MEWNSLQRRRGRDRTAASRSLARLLDVLLPAVAYDQTRLDMRRMSRFGRRRAHDICPRPPWSPDPSGVTTTEQRGGVQLPPGAAGDGAQNNLTKIFCD